MLVPDGADGPEETSSKELEIGGEDTAATVLSTWFACPVKVFPSTTVWVTGQTVVYSDTTSVVTLPTGQFVTVGAHDVMVTIFVE
jgi:hypothetical protein